MHFRYRIYLKLVAVWRLRTVNLHDGDASKYTFHTTSGGVVSWDWDNLLAPDTSVPAIDEFGNSHNGAEFVHELGLGIAFSGTMVPEPTTALMMLLAPLAFRRRRRK